MYAALAVGTMVLLVLSIELAKDTTGIDFERSFGLRLFARVILGSVVWVTPIVAAAACCAVALSRRAPAIWAVVGVVLISLVGSVTNAQLELPPDVARPAIGGGIGFSTESLGLPLSRAAFTLTVVLFAYFCVRRLQAHATSSQVE
jgi:hypothetical protein